MQSSPAFSIAPEVAAALDADILAKLRSQAWRDAERWVPVPENFWLFACHIGRTETLCQASAEDWCAIVEDRLDALERAGEIHRHYRGARLGFIVPARKRNCTRAKGARLSEFDRRFLAAMLIAWDTEPTVNAGGRGAGSGNRRAACGAAEV